MANQPIENVEGIGPVTGEKLRAVGVHKSDDLLSKAQTPAQRKALAEATGLSAQQILKFANMVDLFRIKGVGGQYAELLEAAGVDTVAELARRRADNLTQAMAEANTKAPKVRRVPTLSEVTKWVAHAKELPRTLTY